MYIHYIRVGDQDNRNPQPDTDKFPKFPIQTEQNMDRIGFKKDW